MFSKQFTATVSLIFASLIWGTAFVAQTTGMDFIGPLTFINVRFIIGTVIIFPLALIERDIFFNIERHKKNKLYL